MLYTRCRLKLFTSNKLPLGTTTLYISIYLFAYKTLEGLLGDNEQHEAHQSPVGIKCEDNCMLIMVSKAVLMWPALEPMPPRCK